MTLINGEWAYWDDAIGQRYPWYTSPCLVWLETLDLKGKRIFEYGVGESTLWYRSKGAFVAGVDNNIDWCLKVGAAQCEKLYYPYLNSIEQYEPFDIVVIDGQWRDDCTAYALYRLKAGGYLIIDNYKQPSVEPNWPLTEKQIDKMNVRYFKEPNHQDWVTIVVTK